MSRALVAALLVAQGFDLATYLQAPHLEANPVVAAMTPAAVVVAKVLGVSLALLILTRLRAYPQLQQLGLAIGIAAGAFGVGANVATLSMVTALETSRSAPESAPLPGSSGVEKGAVSVSVAPERTAAPRCAVPRGTSA